MDQYSCSSGDGLGRHDGGDFVSELSLFLF